MIRKVLTRYNGFALWAKIVIAIAVGLLAIGLAVRAGGALKYLIFGNTEAKEARANTVVAEEQGRASKETGIEAAETVVRTYEYHTTVDRTVKEGQNAVNRADKGQQMDPAIDAAGADALCRLSQDLCRN